MDPDFMFPYALQLVEVMMAHTRVVLVSGSPIEAMGPIRLMLGLKADTGEIYASHGRVEGEVFTGEYREFATEEAKEDLVGSLTFDRARSFGFGDTDSDLPLLRAVDNAFALVTSCSEGRAWLSDYVKAASEIATVLYGDNALIGAIQQRVREVFLTPGAS